MHAKIMLKNEHFGNIESNHKHKHKQGVRGGVLQRCGDTNLRRRRRRQTG
jgi:hypothetical protein